MDIADSTSRLTAESDFPTGAGGKKIHFDMLAGPEFAGKRAVDFCVHRLQENALRVYLWIR